MNTETGVTKMNRKDITIALGGNALVPAGHRGTAQEQLARVRSTAKELVRLIESGDRIVVTHGNGPQVGDILVQNEAARLAVPPMPLDICGAESQGMIGYMLQQALEVELRNEGLEMPVVTMLTQVVVSRSDPAFRHPTKPIGPFYTPRQSKRLVRERGWQVVEDSGRGYRRVVPSPSPREIVEARTIRRLYEEGALVIAAGGGGIPVVRTTAGGLRGVEAVLDKDRTAALLATTMKTSTLLILTDVEGVFLDYGGPGQRLVSRMHAAECQRHLSEGQFPPGSMGPKIESAVTFLKAGGERVVISSLNRAEGALTGRAGTTITS
jgi:carbamate kinase